MTTARRGALRMAAVVGEAGGVVVSYARRYLLPTLALRPTLMVWARAGLEPCPVCVARRRGEAAGPVSPGWRRCCARPVSGHVPFLLTSLAMALLVFGLLAFGETVTEQHESVASLYGYFASTVILMLFVRTIPPYTGDSWLA
jgi:hypothetical protein